MECTFPDDLEILESLPLKPYVCNLESCRGPECSKWPIPACMCQIWGKPIEALPAVSQRSCFYVAIVDDIFNALAYSIFVNRHSYDGRAAVSTKGGGPRTGRSAADLAAESKIASLQIVKQMYRSQQRYSTNFFFILMSW